MNNRYIKKQDRIQPKQPGLNGLGKAEITALSNNTEKIVPGIPCYALEQNCFVQDRLNYIRKCSGV
jgi:hypothetical protein